MPKRLFRRLNDSRVQVLIVMKSNPCRQLNPLISLIIIGSATLFVLPGLIEPVQAADQPDPGQTAPPALKMHQIADLLETDLVERFLLEGQVPPKRRAPTSEIPFVSYNMPDNAYMTGMYLANQTYRWRAVQSPEAKRVAFEACNALHTFVAVTGKPGLFARAFIPAEMPYLDDGVWRKSEDGKYLWRGDVSSDQVTGYMYGCSVYAEGPASSAEVQRMAADCVAICDHIVDHGMHIEDVDSKPTMWGHYEPEYVKKSERMNALLWLQHLKVAAQLSGDPKQELRYRRYALEEGYAEAAVQARSVAEPTRSRRVNHSDDVLIFLAYEPLLRLEKDEALRALYLKSLERTWNAVEPERNPFFTYIYTVATGKQDEQALKEVKENLGLFTFDIHWNRETREAYGKRFNLDLEPKVRSQEPKPGERIPYDRRAKTWSLLVHNPYTDIAKEIPRPDEGMEYTGLHWTIGYWMGRAEGFIGAED
ncbi:MAG: hypothetical protein ABIH23_20550 [bacterium]